MDTLGMVRAMPSDFQIAARTVLVFGQHAGEKIDDIASTDKGLLYLDWLYGDLCSRGNRPEIRDALHTYLSEPSIAKALKDLCSNG